MSVATIEQVATSMQRDAPAPSSAEGKAWQMWLDDAELQIRMKLGDVSRLDQEAVALVERWAVEAKIKNPDPVSTRQISVDDGSESSTYTRSSGTVEILQDWWDLLSGRKTRKAFAIDTLGVRGIWDHQPWCSLYFAATYCSCGADIAGEPIYELP